MSKKSANVTMVLVFVVWAGVATLSFCRGVFVNKAIAYNALQTQGFSNIQIIQKVWFLAGWRGCEKRHAARFDATATDPAGKVVQVHVCAGWPFKSVTIRT